MANTLYDLLPCEDAISSDRLLGRFLDYAAGRRLTLYPAQEEPVSKPAGHSGSRQAGLETGAPFRGRLFTRRG